VILTAPNLDPNRPDLAGYFADLDRVRRISFARAQRRERDGTTHAARMQAYQERMDLYVFGLNQFPPRKPRRMRVLPDE